MVLLLGCSGEKNTLDESYLLEPKYTWEELSERPIPQWFDEAKFGIMIHWGVYSVVGHRANERAYAEWTPRHMYQDTAFFYNYFEETFGAHPPEFGYKDLVPMFTAEKWDPKAWAELFSQSGARYVTLTAEHHDGFAMWDSDLTPWCATKIGPMRDLVGELGTALSEKEIKYSTTYHRERHSGFFANNMYSVKSDPFPDIVKEIEMMPEAADLYGPFEFTDEYILDYVARWKEIEQNYKPDFMWLDDIPLFYWNEEDINHPQTIKFKTALLNMIGDYFAASDEWGKEVYLNNKGKHLNWPEGPGCLEMDNMSVDTISPKWENPATLGTSYGYAKTEEEKDAYKSPEQLVHLLCDVVSKNGNLLLNIGPRSDGIIPDGMQRRLLEIGKWLKVNGDAIYGTKHWVTFGQENPDIRFTTKTGALYAISLEKPDSPFTILLKGDIKPGEVKKVTSPVADEDIRWEPAEGGIRIFPPENMGGKYAWVFKIEH